jgi:hypothetical protein
MLIEQRRFEKWPRPSVGVPPFLGPPTGPAWPPLFEAGPQPLIAFGRVQRKIGDLNIGE